MTRAAPTPGTEEAVALAWMKARVEDLSELAPQYSRTAYTHSRTCHVAFANGAVKAEGELAPAPAGSIRDVVDATLTAIREYRRTISGPALLTWRCEPEIRECDSGRGVYCRLTFDPDLWAGQGIRWRGGSY